MLISAFDMSNSTWCPLCRIKVEILDITNNKFCYGCQENTDVYVLKCGNTHGMCNLCTNNFNSAIVDRPRDRENEYIEAVTNENNRIQEELLREEAINKKIVAIKIELNKERNNKIESYITNQYELYKIEEKKYNDLLRTYDSIINVIKNNKQKYNIKTNLEKEKEIYKNTINIYTMAINLIAKDRSNYGRLITTVFESKVSDVAYEAEQSMTKLIAHNNKAYNDYSNSSTAEELYSKKEKYAEYIYLDNTEMIIFSLICAKNIMNNEKLKIIIDNTVKTSLDMDKKFIREHQKIVNKSYVRLKEEEQKKIDEVLQEQQRANHERANVIAKQMNIIFHN